MPVNHNRTWRKLEESCFPLRKWEEKWGTRDPRSPIYSPFLAPLLIDPLAIRSDMQALTYPVAVIDKMSGNWERKRWELG